MTTLLTVEEKDMPATAGGEVPTSFPTARELMRMTREQRQPFLQASALAALPIYTADLAKPERERELTADLETGDIYDETEASTRVSANA